MVVPIMIDERLGLNRCNEPVTVGIPLPKGRVFDPHKVSLFDAEGQVAFLQVRELARWSDRSVKWALLDFPATVAAGQQARYELRLSEGPLVANPGACVTAVHSGRTLRVDTGVALFEMNTSIVKPFDRVLVGNKNILSPAGSQFVFTDSDGVGYQPLVRKVWIEASGPVRATVVVSGEMKGKDQRSPCLFTVRAHFYAGNAFVELSITIHNPRAARHPVGLWDLGDEGSLYFKDLSLHFDLETAGSPVAHWRAESHAAPGSGPSTSVEIYQDSSGGQNWKSHNHANRFGEVTHTHPGYRVGVNGQMVAEGERATPVLGLSDGAKGMAGSIRDFWQNFPKSVETCKNQLTLRLFPKQYGDLFELQGGEQKTHVVFLEFGKTGDALLGCAWGHGRLVPRVSPEWYAMTQAVSYLVPRAQEPDAEDLKIIDTAVTGDRSFVARREIIDEYGWRHFGDLYADHEAVRHTGEEPRISHYNNQYDAIYGAGIQYMATGDERWFRLMAELARHVIDIDIYHTQADSSAYNGGLFWHTDHYRDAATCTHRAYSRANAATSFSGQYGGGPSNEHNYTTGLLQYHFLTGDNQAREAVFELADWVRDMDDGAKRRFGWLDRRPTGTASITATPGYHGPGRGAGNSVNALLDAFAVSEDIAYLLKAEELIRRCIHPKDDIGKRNLDDVEHRWSYTVFLQALGKYLDVKEELGGIDYMYGYARESLLHYARWMVDNEVPYSQVLDRVEIPTETWPASDIRKAVVLHLAAKHVDEPLRTVLRRKAEFFFGVCLKDLLSFETWWLTRPIVLLMTNSYVHAYFRRFPMESSARPASTWDFGSPGEFFPQFSGLRKAKQALTKMFLRIGGARA